MGIDTSWVLLSPQHLTPSISTFKLLRANGGSPSWKWEAKPHSICYMTVKIYSIWSLAHSSHNPRTLPIPSIYTSNSLSTDKEQWTSNLYRYRTLGMLLPGIDGRRNEDALHTVNEIKLFHFQDHFILFGRQHLLYVFHYLGRQRLKEPIKDNGVLKHNLTTTSTTPFMNVIGDMGCSILVTIKK